MRAGAPAGGADKSGRRAPAVNGALRFPRGGNGLVVGASVAAFGAYYACVVTGESLADRLVVLPFVGMWMANALLLASALLAVRRSRTPLPPRGNGPVAIRG